MSDEITGSLVKAFHPDTAAVTYALPYSVSANGHTNLPYFFEGHPKLLDAEEEWSYDVRTNTLLVWMPRCSDPAEAVIRGRVRDMSLSLVKSTVTLQGIALFGTTLSSAQTTMSFEGVDFAYPTFNKRTIGDLTPAVQTDLQMAWSNTLTMKDSTVLYADGPYFLSKVNPNAVFRNNTFKGSCYATGSTATITSHSSPADMIFDHNTVTHFNSASGVLPSYRASITNNVFANQGAEMDGAAVHIQAPYQTGTVATGNWIYDIAVKAVRCDRINSDSATWGENATISSNVAWCTGGIFIKGDNHRVENNVVFNSSAASQQYGDIACIMYGCKIAKRWAKKGENSHTVLRNNIADSILNVSGTFLPLASNNMGDLRDDWWTSELKDPASFDFRPKPGSQSATKEVGAYPAGMLDADYTKALPGSHP